MIGKTVGKYRIVDRLGRGGMGTVYKAVDETLDREVAIKVLNPDIGESDVLKRFRAEAITLARLNHPGIATIFELHRHDDDLLMVMEFVRGETFHDLTDRLGPLAPPQAAHLCMQVLDALAHAHRAGVVHRDLKPANLMVTESGSVKVMDFGIARVLGAEHFTYGGYMMGTPAFMAPEQVLGREVDGRADLYAVGVVLYRLLSGQLPFDADTAMAIVQKQVSEPPTPIANFCPDLPPWCSALIEHALAKAPKDRFQTAEEFRAALVGAVQPQTLGELPTLATPTPPGLQRHADATHEITHAVTGASAYRRSQTIGAAVATPPSQPVTVGASVTPVTSSSTPAPETRSPQHITTTTVVLGRTHLAALAALFVVLVGGIAVLGFAALRRGTFPQQLPLLGTLPPAPAPAPAAEPAPPTANADVSTTAKPDASTSAKPDASTAAKSDASTPAKPPAPLNKSAGPFVLPSASPVAATAGTGPATPTGSAIPPGGRGTAAPGTAVPDAAKARGTTVPVAPPVPAKAVEAAPAVSFNDVRLLVKEANDRGRERQVILRVGDGQISLSDPSGGSSVRSIAYSDISDAFYSRSKQPKWRDASGKEVEYKVELGRMGFFRGERNWLILFTSGEPLIVRLEDSHLQKVLPAVQERTGVNIRR